MSAYIVVEVDVKDASGKRWFKRKYKAELTEASYGDNQPGQKDPYQDLYNTIANDIILIGQNIQWISSG